MRTAARLLILRAACALGLLLLGAGVAGIFVASQHPAPVKSILGLGFLLSIVASSLLVLLRCPACGQRFTGSQAPGDVAPLPKLFAKCCRHCGHRPT
jgi:hypothetical protein